MRKVLFASLMSIFGSLQANSFAKNILEDAFALHFSARTSYDLPNEFSAKLTSTSGFIADSSFLPEPKVDETLSFHAQIYSNISVFDLGGGLGYQVPTNIRDLGDFYFIPYYFFGKIHFYNYKNIIDIYGIYDLGWTFSKGSAPYNTGDLNKGNYFAYGVGFRIFGDIDIEFVLRDFSAQNNNFEHEYEQDKITKYDIDLEYQTYSIVFGINNVFNDFLNNLY